MCARILAAAALLAAFSGCKPPPLDEIEPEFRKQVNRHFLELNKESQFSREQFREERLRAENDPARNTPTGIMFHSYLYKNSGFIVKEFPCRSCGAKLLLASPKDQSICPACLHSPYRVHPPDADLRESPCKHGCVDANGAPVAPSDEIVSWDNFSKFPDAKVLHMFELTQEDTNEPLEATVRYVRRTWTFDEKGTLTVKPKALERTDLAPDAPSKWFPTRGARDTIGKEEHNMGQFLVNYAAQGFHRPGSLFVGEMRFMFKAGKLIQLGKTEEEPVRPWKDLERKAD